VAQAIKQSRHAHSLPRALALRAHAVDYPQQQSHLQVMRRYAANFTQALASETQSHNLILCGNVGTGKTFLGCALLAELLQQGVHCLYTRASSLVRSIQHTYHPHTHDTEQSTLKHFIVPDCVTHR
jgi:DNA replication protein DnaC